ncbi:MAG: helix-turn-helix domain-containing protein, partial [Erysipelotrichaceae bacterium]|nr:helix-turn-helix domain-containing protein [Erysipelotrichaceae bacterium]
MTEFEIEKDDSFTVVTNNILRNKNLSMSAKGLLCTIFSLPPEWDYSFNGLVAICKEGKAAVRNAINELKNSKYIKISQSRNEKGYYQYKYTVYRKPYEEIQKNEFHPTPDYRSTDYRTSENQQQLNTNKLKDKYDNIDKTKIPEHHYLTKELFKLNYISDTDSSSFLFDDLFNNYLSNGFTFGNIISSIHYIVPRVVNRKFIDEDGKEIKNKYG